MRLCLQWRCNYFIQDSLQAPLKRTHIIRRGWALVFSLSAVILSHTLQSRACNQGISHIVSALQITTHTTAIKSKTVTVLNPPGSAEWKPSISLGDVSIKRRWRYIIYQNQGENVRKTKQDYVPSKKKVLLCSPSKGGRWGNEGRGSGCNTSN